MKFTRSSAVIMAAVMAASAVGVTAFAEEDAEMKKVLTNVKERLDIPEELTDFDYRTSTQNGRNLYTFTWSTPAGSEDYQQYHVTISGKVIKSVNIYNNNYNWEPSFAKLSDEKLMEACKKYIKEINPTIDPQIAIDEDSFSISLYGEQATLRFHRSVEGHPVTGQTGSVTVNKDTGELMGYRLNWVNGAGFSAPDGAISETDAKTAYEKLFDSELTYTTEYDWEKKEYIPHLIYAQTESGQINAFTGEKSTFEDYDSYAGDDSIAEEADMEMGVAETTAASGANGIASKAVSFSENELAKLEQENKLIKAEDAMKTLRATGVLYIPEDAEITWQNCYYNERSGYYIRRVQFESNYADYIDLNGDDKIYPIDDVVYEEYRGMTVSGSFTINAETGELLSYYNYAPDDGTSSLDSAAAAKTAADAVKKLAGSKASKFGTLEQKYTNTVGEKGSERTVSISYSANRVENGINCRSEGVSVEVGSNGYVTSYNLNYNEKVSYPKPTGIISKSEAYKKFFDQVNFELKYRCAYRTSDKKVVTALVYAADSDLLIDAFTGKRTDYNGRTVTDAELSGEYADIAGTAYEEVAEKLARYGITLMDDNNYLNADMTITADEFCGLLGNIGIGYDNIEAISGTTKLNRRMASQIVVTAKYGKDVAEMASIFKSKFADVPENSAGIGYIAIADASGLITGKDGKFSPAVKFTRGDALMLAYNYLSE